jgi:formyltetrahydrofolate-dependent phosphoribosylglycinamide formyltransferase
MTVNLAVLISGGGSHLPNFIERIADGRLDAQIQVVVASNASAGGIAKARAAGIDCEVVDWRDYGSEAAFSEAVTKVLDRYDIDFVVQAGLLRKYLFPERWRGRVLNVHPGLLPKYGGHGMYGHHVHEAVLATGETESGCTVHITDEEYDHGPIILQKRVPVFPDDTPETLARRVFEAECDAYPEAIELMARAAAAKS